MPGPTCPNRALDPGETCDDGNSTTGDGCDASCHLEQATAADNCPGTPITARRGTQWYTGTTIGATSGFNCGGADVGPDRVYDLTIAEGGTVTIELVPETGFDVVFNSRAGMCPGTYDTFCIDAAGAGGPEYVMGATAATGAHYTVVIDGYTLSAGSYRWRITIM
jgi:cysteine-rich repeat protein